MANRALINPQILTDIADSIREKTGKTEPIKVSQMASEIGGISVGGSSGGNIDVFPTNIVTRKLNPTRKSIVETFNFNATVEIIGNKGE